jgi:hypothetical protein
VAVGPDVAQLRALVERLELAAARVEAARTVAARRKAPTVAAASKPLDRAQRDLALLGEVVGTWCTAPDLERLTGYSQDTIRRVLGAWTDATEEHPSALVETDKRAGATWYRATADGEEHVSRGVSFDPADLDGLARAMAREHEECGE